MNQTSEILKHPSSYRDPAGFIFFHNNVLYRQVNSSYKPHFELLVNSGLFKKLVEEKMLISHEQIKENFSGKQNWYTTIQPETVPFISYPYEWSFDMLKDAALLTLSLMEKSVTYGMILKDATPYNIQLYKGKMIFIDTLSFEIYNKSKPWIAYRQFCEQFLAPLALMNYTQIPLSQLLLAYPEGIPLHLASALLPWKTKWNLHLQLHIHLHGRVSSRKTQKGGVKPFSKQKLLHILSSLRAAIESLKLNYKGVWWDYYGEAGQRDNYVAEKKKLIDSWISQKSFTTVFDAGANDGTFSELLLKHDIFVVSGDSDHFAINELYKKTRASGGSSHPLIVDLANPSPAIGVNNEERPSLIERINVDLVMALAVIHHLCIGRNIPFEKAVQLFRGFGKSLIIEFVPREDEKIELMLQHKEDIYQWYTQQAFEQAFSACYRILKKETIQDSVRTLYLMEAV